MTSKKPPFFVPFLLFALAGVVMSFLTLRHHVLITERWSTGPSFCNISTAMNCDAVAASPYSVLFGLPLGAWGIIFFGLLGLIKYASIRSGTSALDGAILLLSAIGALGSIVFFAISKFLVGTLCILCIGVYICAFALFLLAFFALPRQQRVLEALRAPGCFISQLGAGPQLSVLLLLWILIGALSPYLVTEALRPVAPTLSEQETIEKQWFALWKNAPKHELPTVASGPLRDYVEGPSFSPVSIVKFSDYQCGACRYAFQQLEPILEKYRGKYSLTIKNFPLDPSCNPIMRGAGGHKHACQAAIMAICAGEQDKFWQVAHRIFLLPELDHSTTPEGEVTAALNRLITTLGLDDVEFKRCLNSARAEQKILADVKLAMELEVNSTPTIFINGRKIPGFNPQYIEKIIASGGQ